MKKNTILAIVAIAVVVGVATAYVVLPSLLGALTGGVTDGATEIEFRTGNFTSDIFEVRSDTWQLLWEMTSGRGSGSHFRYEIFEEGGVTPIDSWQVDADRFPDTFVSGRSVDLVGPGRFFYKIDASPDFQWLVSIREI